MALSLNASSYALSNYTSSTGGSKSSTSLNASSNALSNYTSMASSPSSGNKSTSTSVNASSNALSNYTSLTSPAVSKTISPEAWNASATPSTPTQSKPTPNASTNALANYTKAAAATKSAPSSPSKSTTPTPNASTNALANYVKAAAAALKTSSPSNSSSATPNASTNALSNYLKQGESSQRASINASTSALANYTESVARSAAKQAKDTPEQLGPGWSRDQNGKLRYESDLISQLLVPGRGPADQVATHLANGDYWQVAIAGVAWLAEDLLFVASLGGSQARTAGTRIAAEGVKKATQAAATATPKGQVYSVAAEVKLSPTSYPGVSRRAHIQEANEHLLGSMEADPSLAQRMGGMGIKIDRTVTGRSPSSPPSDWTWHHAPEPGIVQLVPREQHASGSIFQRTLHPGGIGGYAIWGRK